MKIKFKTVIWHFQCTINGGKMSKSPVCGRFHPRWGKIHCPGKSLSIHVMYPPMCFYFGPPSSLHRRIRSPFPSFEGRSWTGSGFWRNERQLPFHSHMYSICGDTVLKYICRIDLHENSEATTVTATFVTFSGLKSNDVSVEVYQSRLTVSGEIDREQSLERKDGTSTVCECHRRLFTWRTQLHLPWKGWC